MLRLCRACGGLSRLSKGIPAPDGSEGLESPSKTEWFSGSHSTRSDPQQSPATTNRRPPQPTHRHNSGVPGPRGESGACAKPPPGCIAGAAVSLLLPQDYAQNEDAIPRPSGYAVFGAVKGTPRREEPSFPARGAGWASREGMGRNELERDKTSRRTFSADFFMAG